MENGDSQKLDCSAAGLACICGDSQLASVELASVESQTLDCSASGLACICGDSQMLDCSAATLLA